MVSAREIQAVAELLQISPEGLQKAITFKVTVSPQPPPPPRGCLSLLPVLGRHRLFPFLQVLIL